VHRKRWLISVLADNSIAVVDDETDLAFMFRDALGQIPKFNVYAFTDPIMALEHFKMNINNYVILLSDLRMPGLNGLELIRRVKSLKPSTRTLLMTAFDVDRDNIFQKYLADNTINRFIQKPITLKDLCSEVTNQIRLLSDRKEKTSYII